MTKGPDILREYQSLITEQLIIKPVVNNNALAHDTCVHYMPHHPVVKQNKSTTKVQIVYDGSASSPDNLSLNGCLQVGPNLIPKMFNIMSRSRCHQVALVADTEKAFLMVGIAKENRDMLRFL